MKRQSTTVWKCSCTPQLEFSPKAISQHLETAHGIQRLATKQQPFLRMKMPLRLGVHRLESFACGPLTITKHEFHSYPSQSRLIRL